MESRNSNQRNEMKAVIIHSSVEGRSRVILKGISENIELYFSNLGGGKDSEGVWWFSRSAARHVPESLDEEGYEIKTEQLI